jgi:hypothetical protein
MIQYVKAALYQADKGTAFGLKNEEVGLMK